jgi:hypothetical protein
VLAVDVSVTMLQPESLADLMKFDHGYTASSPPIRNVSQTVLYLVCSLVCSYLNITHAKETGVEDYLTEKFVVYTWCNSSYIYFDCSSCVRLWGSSLQKSNDHFYSL